jgi:hypothetical protein
MKSKPVPPQEMSYPPGNVTELSRPRSADRRKFRHLWRVARLSLFLAVLAALGGLSCLITSSPDFAKPTRTPPFLTGLTPAPYLVVSVRAVSPGMYLPQQIGFQIVSEDLQSAPLQGLLIRDFEGFSAPIKDRLWLDTNIPPGHFNDPSAPTREPIKIEFPFPVGINPGCHSVTLAVSHEFTSDLGTNKIAPKDPGDIATATWWYELTDPIVADPPPGCGGPVAPMSDAGADVEGGVP